MIVIQLGMLIASSLAFVWEAWGICVAVDVLVWFSLLRSRRSQLRKYHDRFRQIEETFQQFWQLTQENQERWQSTWKTFQEVVGDESRNLGIVEVNWEGLQPKTLRTHTIESMINGIQSMMLLSHQLSDDLDTVLAYYQDFLHRLTSLQSEYRLNHFRLEKSVALLSTLGKETNQYSETMVLEVLSSFREITAFSEGISKDVLSRVQLLSDPSNPQSLHAISHGSVEIHDTLDRFFGDLDATNRQSQTAIANNSAQMERVQEIADSISDFSENIRMISLNLNIEAARSGQHGGGASAKGFQVLATKLSEYALKAQELAQQQHGIIATASKVMKTSSETQIRQLKDLTTKIPRIQEQMDDFRSIISQAYQQLEGVTTTMESLSSQIDQKLKGVIGKFQFQDLVRQEQEHSILMLEYLWKLASRIKDTQELEPALQESTFSDLMQWFETLASTENEVAVLRSMRNKMGVDAADDDAVKAGSVSLF